VQRIARLFTELWYEGCKWEIPPGKVYTVAERSTSEPPTRPDYSSQNRFVWTNGPDQTSLLKSIQEIINASEQQLVLSTYSVVGMRENRSLIFSHLEQAISRGVAIKFFVRQRNAWPEQMADLLALAEIGIEIHGDLRNHAKVVIADRQVGVIFSANFDAAHGLTSGVEAGVRLDAPSAISHLCNYLDHAIENADVTFKRNPTIGELDGQLAARWCQKWTLSTSLDLNGTGVELEAFCREAKTGLCLYEYINEDELWLYTGRIAAKLHVQNNSGKCKIDSIRESKVVENRFQKWLVSVRDNSVDSLSRKGFCPATLVYQGVR